MSDAVVVIKASDARPCLDPPRPRPSRPSPAGARFRSSTNTLPRHETHCLAAQSTEDWNKALADAGDLAVVVDFFADCE